MSVVEDTTEEDAAEDLWAVTPTGNWQQDNIRGRQLARDLCARMRKDGAFHLLNFTMMAMMEKPRCPGIETGFFHELAERICD